MQENVIARLRSAKPSLSPALQRIADYVLKDSAKVVYQTITEIADNSGASEASVLRFCRDLGFSSFQRFKLALGIQLSGGSAGLPNQPSGDVLADTLATAITALQQTKDLLDRSVLQSTAKTLIKSRSIDIYGLGGSANVARYAHYSFVRIGLISRIFDDPHMAIMSAVELGPKQAAIGISESGSSKDTVDSLKAAKDAGAFTIAVTGHIRSPIASIADAVLAASSTETPFTRGAFSVVAGQFLIFDVLTTLIARSDPKFENAVRKTAGAGIDTSY